MNANNLLGDLTAVIETIRRRIGEYGNAIAQSETRTRQVLIDPLLTALGWDVSDPGRVTLEYSSGGGRADYALLGAGGLPVAVVEAKKLHAHLDGHVMQVLNYANSEGIKYMAITNGDEWRMYDVFKQAALQDQDRLLMQLGLSTNPVHETALQALRLWRTNAAAMPAAEPMLAVPDGKPAGAMPGKRTTGESVQKQNPGGAEAGWLSLNAPEVLTQWKRIEKQAGRHAPISVRFANREHAYKMWADALAGIVGELLVKPGRLTKRDCPVRCANSTRSYFVHSTPAHADNREFSATRELPHGLYMHCRMTLKAMLATICETLRRFEVEPAEVQVRLQAKRG